MTSSEQLLVAALFVALITIVSVSSECEASDLRLGVMPTSHHFSDRKDGEEWNEDHNGLIIEYKVSENSWLGAMDFTNSHGSSGYTVYGINDTLIYDGDIVDWGLQYGAVYGYDYAEHLPYVLPVVSVEFFDGFKVRSHFFGAGLSLQFTYEVSL